MAEPVGVAMIGTGMWGRKLAEAVRRTPELRLVTAYSRDEAKRAAFCAEFGCRPASSLEAALEQAEVQAVLLVTPNSQHREAALAAAEYGKHVFIEKPIADSLEDGQAIRKAFEGSGLTLMVGHCFRRLGAARKAKQLLDEGMLGEVILAEANFSLPGTLTPDKWRSYRQTCPGGPLMQLGVHHADTLQYWLGPVRRVRGTFNRVVTTAEIDDVGAALLDFAGGARGTIASSYVSPKTYWLRLYGAEGNLDYQTDMTVWPKAEGMDDNTRLILQTKSGRVEAPFERRDMLVEELQELARCARGEARPETGAEQGLAALEVILGALQSYERGEVYEMRYQGNG